MTRRKINNSEHYNKGRNFQNSHVSRNLKDPCSSGLSSPRKEAEDNFVQSRTKISQSQTNLKQGGYTKCNTFSNSPNSVTTSQPAFQQQNLLLTPQNHSNSVYHGGSQGSIRKPFPPLDPNITNSIGKLEQAASIRREKIMKFLEQSPENAKHFIIVTKSSKFTDTSQSAQNVGPSTVMVETPGEKIPTDHPISNLRLTQ
ncbi:hypothetical protein AVEN_77828-1 [Araneus ventricosus]|uniref:Uncharacterized protein n=1 Tax=Araneus ventricosus TaxID=182803 RepID=A0A4Y2GMP8_ARAVE|nr:hypothetical protein AVEN_77828-1 [Araneus ventricosus]